MLEIDLCFITGQLMKYWSVTYALLLGAIHNQIPPTYIESSIMPVSYTHLDVYKRQLNQLLQSPRFGTTSMIVL